MVNCIHTFIEDNQSDLTKIAVMRVGEKYGHDLVQDIFLTILECETDKYVQMCSRGELIYYVIKWIQICQFSKTTRFYYKYHKWQESVTFEYPMNAVGSMPDTYQELDYQEQLAAIEKLLESHYWFDAEIFKVYYLHNHSINTLNNATGISRKTIQSSLRKTKSYIKANREKIQGTR